MRVLTIVVVSCAPLLAAPGAAWAVVSNVHLVDGPSAEVQDASVDAAMSEDGTGGVVYLKNVDGRDHVFATQFRNGDWRPPQRVDVGQAFDSSWPRIGAGDGGRLVVTWVQEFGVGTDRMFSATLDPGSSGFRDPVPVDFNVGEATSTFPDLAMSRGGQAYLAYDVITDTSPSNPQGYVGVDVRLARYGNRLWSVLGSPIDRNNAIPMRQPTADNAPEVGIDVQGQGVVAWQEPDDEFVDRIWARRVFDTRLGIPLQVSPSTYDGAPLRGPADAFSLDVSGFAQAAVAFRQQPGQSSRLDAPHVFVNEMPDVFSEGAEAFGEARVADGAARGGLGVPSVAVDPRSLFVTAFGSGPETMLAAGDDGSVAEAVRIDTGASSIAGDPLVDLAETGAAVAAWRELRGGAGLLAVQERRADGVVEATTLSAPRGGSVGGLAMGGSGLGDAIVAWPQGSGTSSQVAATVIDAPPDPFFVLLPDGWQRKRKIPIAWDKTLNAIGGITYSVSVDDEPVIDGVKKHKARLGRDDVDDGRHRIQVFAIDDAGQETGSLTGRLLVDRNAPEVELKRQGRKLEVTVSDGDKGDGSGLKGAAKVSFGDGARAKATGKKGGAARAGHRFKRRGTYAVSVKARDGAGNKVAFRKKVRIG